MAKAHDRNDSTNRGNRDPGPPMRVGRPLILAMVMVLLVLLVEAPHRNVLHHTALHCTALLPLMMLLLGGGAVAILRCVCVCVRAASRLATDLLL